MKIPIILHQWGFKSAICLTKLFFIMPTFTVYCEELNNLTSSWQWAHYRRRLVASANSFFPFKNKWREIKIFFLNGLCREIQRRTQRLLNLDMLAWLTRGEPPVVYNWINWSPWVTFYEDDMLPIHDCLNLFSLRKIFSASSWESMWGVGIQGSKILLMKTHTRRSLLNTNNPTCTCFIA
jgi:hypothetical protein